MLSGIIIPFFNKFNFLSPNQKRNFSIFKEIIRLMDTWIHLSEEGFNKIIDPREILNKGKGRKRKYEKDNLNYEKSPETIRQNRQ